MPQDRVCRHEHGTARRAAEHDTREAAGSSRHCCWKVDLDGKRPLVGANGACHLGDDALESVVVGGLIVCGIDQHADRVTNMDVRCASLIHANNDLPRTAGLDSQQRDAGCCHVARIDKALDDQAVERGPQGDEGFGRRRDADRRARRCQVRLSRFDGRLSAGETRRGRRQAGLGLVPFLIGG